MAYLEMARLCTFSNRISSTNGFDRHSFTPIDFSSWRCFSVVLDVSNGTLAGSKIVKFSYSKNEYWITFRSECLVF